MSAKNKHLFEPNIDELLCKALMIDTISLSDEKKAAIFNQLTLSNEIKSKKIDTHQRFNENQIAWEYQTPWINKLIPSISLDNSFNVIFSHDVDWSTGFNIISLIKSFKNSSKYKRRSWLSFKECLDPFLLENNLRKLLQFEKDRGVRAWYFLLAEPFTLKRYGARYRIDSFFGQRMVEVIENNDGYIGLHGSYYAKDKNSYAYESHKLASICGHSIVAHRNHYLRFDNIHLFEQLEQANIQYDFSIGYANHAGFRAGIATPYRGIHLKKHHVSNVIEIPLVFMDRFNHIEDPKATLQNFVNILFAAKQAKGTVSVLIHPEMFVIEPRWWGIYEAMIDIAKSFDAKINGQLPKLNNYPKTNIKRLAS